MERSKLVNTIRKFHTKDEHDERKCKLSVGNKDSQKGIKEIVSFWWIGGNGLFEAELNWDEDTETGEEKERAMDGSSFLFFEDFTVAFVVIEDVGFHKIAFSDVVAKALSAFAVVRELVDGCDLLLVFFGVLVDLWLLTGEDDGPDDQDGEPEWEQDNASDGKGIGLILGKIVDFAVPEIECNFHILRGAFAGDADSSERVDVGSGVFDGDEVVRVVGKLFAFVELAGVVGGDAGVHDGGQGNWRYVKFDDVFDELFDEGLALFGLCLSRVKQRECQQQVYKFHWIKFYLMCKL